MLKKYILEINHQCQRKIKLDTKLAALEEESLAR